MSKVHLIQTSVGVVMTGFLALSSIRMMLIRPSHLESIHCSLVLPIQYSSSVEVTFDTRDELELRLLGERFLRRHRTVGGLSLHQRYHMTRAFKLSHQSYSRAALAMSHPEYMDNT